MGKASCLSTLLCPLPPSLYAPPLRPSCLSASTRHLSAPGVGRLALLCLAAALALACTNIGLGALSLPLAQVVRATQPLVTLLVEGGLGGAMHTTGTYASLLLIVIGAELARSGSCAADANVYGITFMALALVASAVKYVIMKDTVRSFKAALSPLGLLFWMEAGIGAILLPWALLNGELRMLITTTPADKWPMLLASALLGGLRTLSQIVVLGHVSATTVSVTSSLAIPAITVILSFPLFGTTPTPRLVVGFVLSMVGTACYSIAKPQSQRMTATPLRVNSAPWKSTMATVAVLGCGAGFSVSPAPVQRIALATVGGGFATGCAMMSASALTRWGPVLRRTRAEEVERSAAGGRAPSLLHRVFRLYYLVVQQAPQPARAWAWYAFLWLVLCIALQAVAGGLDPLSLRPPVPIDVRLVIALRLVVPFLLCFTPLPRRPGLDGEPLWTNDPNFLRRIGAVIPCHRSADEIGETVRSIMRHIPASNIVVVDNADSHAPLDDTAAVVRNVHPDVSVIYVPRGLKSFALWTGIERLPRHVEFVMHVDDDTKLSDDMVFDESWFLRDPLVSEVTYPVFTRHVNLLTDAIGFQFKRNAHASRFHNVTSGTSLWAPGIIGLARRDVLTMVMRDHVYLPFGEDVFHGHLQLMNGYKIVRETRSHVVTFAPPVLSSACAASVRTQGYGATSLWKQRAQRWSVTRLRRLGWTALLALFYRGDTLWSNVWFRLSRVPVVFSNLVAIGIVLPLFLAYAVSLATGVKSLDVNLLLDVVGAALSLKVIDWLINLLGAAWINYILWRHRPDFQVSLSVVLVSPLFSDFVDIAGVVGCIVALTHWIPLVPTRVWDLTKETMGVAAAEKGHRRRDWWVSKAWPSDTPASEDRHVRKIDTRLWWVMGRPYVSLEEGIRGGCREERHPSLRPKHLALFVAVGGIIFTVALLSTSWPLQSEPRGKLHMASVADTFPLAREANGLCTVHNHTDDATHAVKLPLAQSFLHVIGWPRTGSSLLAAVLDGHPHVAMANEFDTLSFFASRAAVLAPMPAGLVALSETNSDVVDGRAMEPCNHMNCPAAAVIQCSIVERTTCYRSPKLASKWAIAGTAQGWETKLGTPLQMLGGKKVGRPLRRHAANPAASWAIIDRMNATLPPAKWIYLYRDPHAQISTCLVRKYCSDSGLDYYKDKEKWRAAAPLPLNLHTLDKCIADFELVAMAVADLVPALPARGYGPLLSLSYEELCASPAPTLHRVCSFLDLDCSVAYISAISTFIREPHSNSRFIDWESSGNTTAAAARVDTMIRRQSAALQLMQYIP